MASKDPFNFADAGFVLPIVCLECGGNAHVIRREPRNGIELQTFKCTECGAEEQRDRGAAESDECIQREAELRSGVRPLVK